MNVQKKNATELAQKTLADCNVTLTASAFDKLVTVYQHYLIGFISLNTLEEQTDIIITKGAR